MKIFFPIGSFYPAQIGGPDNIMYWHAKALVKRRHQVWVCTTDDGIGKDIPLNEWITNEAGQVLYARTAIHYAPLRMLWYSLRPLLGCQIIHLSAIFYPSSWILGCLALLLGKRVVWTVHGELDPDALIYSASRKKWVLAFVRWWSKRVLFHTTCDAESQYVRQVFGNNTRVKQVPYFMELPDRLKRTANHSLLYVGRIHPKKAIEQLIQALALSERFLKSSYVLNIVGDHRNDYGAQLQQLVEQLSLTERVTFVGHQAGQAKYQYMANAYLQVMPSHTENFGIVVTEALTQGTPVVASKGTPWAILEKEQVGYWVNNTPKTLAQTIDTALSLAPDAYQAMRARAEEVVRTHFEIDANIGIWEEIYHQTWK
jgi:glycosyltransferase involved in cell wall biosynthesis